MKHNRDTAQPELLTRTSAHQLRGILLPITTPFNETEDLDLDGLCANIRHWNPTGISGYVVLGSTGERVNLSEREAQQVIETARVEVPERLTFIVGAGQQSTRLTIAEIKRAAAAGADAVLVITPSFYRAAITPTALVNHYRSVAEASPVPVILYSMPDLTGIAIEPATIAQLSEHQNIIGIKDSSNDVPRFKEALRLDGEEFTVLTGNGPVLFDTVSVGAAGAILAVGCVATAQCLRIYENCKSGDLDSAAALQQKLTPLALAVTKRYGIGGLKAAMDLIGLRGGAVRAPLRSPDDAARNELRQLLANAGIECPAI